MKKIAQQIFGVILLSFLISSFFLSCSKKPSCESCFNDNKPPIAKAGNDRIIVLPLDSINLDGSGSADPDGNINEYLWAKISGPSSFLFVNPDSVNAIIKNLTKGVYEVELKVTDNDGLSAKDTLTITVDSVVTLNHPPIAKAGSDQTLLTPPDFLFDGINTLLDGGQSVDPDSNIYSYQWSKISGASSPSLSNAMAVQTGVTFFEYGIYEFELNVTDNGGLSSKDTVVIKVEVTDTANQAPVANAGQDQVIYLPANTITLNGSMTSDPNNNITTYLWTKISGPSSFNISNREAAQTQVTSLIEGVYQFELKVTDATALFSTDTTQVIVRTCGANRPTVVANPVPFAKLLKPRKVMAVASAANKIVFAGGLSTEEPYGSSAVDIYDITTQTWTSANLSVPRYSITTIAAGTKIFFAGGFSGEVGDVNERYHAVVDIYDASTNTWSVTHMNQPGYSMSAATVGNKVLFAGGFNQVTNNNTVTFGISNLVQVYDIATGNWSIYHLNESKAGISAVTVNNKVYFAGGQSIGNSNFSSQIDIYDNVTNSWSSSTLSTSRIIGGGGIAVNNKIFWAGGYDGMGPTCKVEIKDPLLQTTSFDYLSRADIVKAYLVNDKIVYFSFDKKFDIYDTKSNSWSVGILPKTYELSFAANNTIYVTGADDNFQDIWKLDF